MKYATGELKPCPFCGKEPEVRVAEDAYARIRCSDMDCPANSNVWFDSLYKAVEAWNKRTEDDDKVRR